MIRTAKVDDIPALVELGAKFHAMSPHKAMGDYDNDGVARMLAFMIESRQSVVLFSGQGLIGGTFSPVYFAPSKWLAEENFLFADKDGFALLDAFCGYAESWGAHYVLMSSLENERAPAMRRILGRKGFKPIETRYLLEL